MNETMIIDKLSHEGRGIARLMGKVCFVDNALPDEEVVVQLAKKRGRFLEGSAIDVLRQSEKRVSAPCHYFGQCGGCSLQHFESGAQIHFKQSILAEQLKNKARAVPETWSVPLQEKIYGYRHRARLSVRFVSKKNETVIGFREKNGRYVADLESCEVLHPSVGQHLLDLKKCLNSLEAKKTIAQIEVLVSEDEAALVIRHLEPLSKSDCQKIAAFGEACHFKIYLQSGGLETITLFYPEAATAWLHYHLKADNIDIRYPPQAFTQVNFSVNEKMIAQAIHWLQLSAEDRVLDLFCGLGNFTLPVSKQVSHALGLEADALSVENAKNNAHLNGCDRAQFALANLFDENPLASFQECGFNKLILDPPRRGAPEVVSQIERVSPSHILYVSCHVATLVRDIEILVHEKGYHLIRAGVIDMFPQTAHVESMCLLEKRG